MRGKFEKRKKKQTEKEKKLLQDDRILEQRSSVSSTLTGVWDKEFSWQVLIFMGTVLTALIAIAGLIYNHWVGTTLRTVASVFYVIGAFVSAAIWQNDVGEMSRSYRFCSLKRSRRPWLLCKSLAKSIIWISFFLIIGVCAQCLILSNWSMSEYQDNAGVDHSYTPFYYQKDRQFLQRYPTFWAAPWTKIAVLPPLNGSYLKIEAGSREVIIDFEAEYDRTVPREKLEKLFSGKKPEDIRKSIEGQIATIVRQQMRATAFTGETIRLGLPLNTVFLADIDPIEVKNLKESITQAIKQNIIDGITIRSVGFPIWS